jgi:RNA polymerase sigma-70 factor (ECF subfamily)
MNQFDVKEVTDKILLQKTREGDGHAFKQLFQKYWQPTFSEVYKRIGDQDHSKDIVQEIFTHIWARRETLIIENLPAYLETSIRNRVIKFATRQKLNHPFFRVAEYISEKNAGADSNLLYKELHKSYEALLDTLPRKRQMIFRLRYQENLRTGEISQLLGITRKTVQNQLGKAIETLKISLIRLFILTIIINVL